MNLEILKSTCDVFAPPEPDIGTPYSVTDILCSLNNVSDGRLVCLYNIDTLEVLSSWFDNDSWRGSYNLPAIDFHKPENHLDFVNVAEAIRRLNEIDGKEVTGWKGGEFILDSSDTLFVANVGESNYSTAIVDIQIRDDYCIMYIKQDMY